MRYIFPGEETRYARDAIRSWSEYGSTPVVEDREEAVRLGLGALYAKVETSRFGAGSFKVLGGAYAVAWHAAHGRHRSHYVCASAGNHGLAVAWGARRLGRSATVFLPSSSPTSRMSRIEQEGAEIRVVDGDYDAALEMARSTAGEGLVLVSDYSDRSDDRMTRLVMHGYTCITAELRATFGTRPPTHVFVPVGVGGLAAALLAGLYEAYPTNPPAVVLVEPARAACTYERLRARRRLRLGRGPASELVCLACRMPSAPAWEILAAGAEWALIVTDDEVRCANRSWSASARDARPRTDGNCGPASLAAVRLAASEPSMRRSMGLDDRARVLVLITE